MSVAINKKEILLLCLVLISLAALALRPSIRGNDGVGNYVYLASLLRSGDLDFSDDYWVFDNLKKYPYRFAELPVSPITERASNRYGIGSALLWSPFALAAHGLTKLLDPALATAMSRPYEWAVGVGTAFWGSLALGMIYIRLRRSWPPLAGVATLAAWVFATPLGFYLYAHGSMSHGASFFAATGAMLAFERAWRKPGYKNSALLGCWCALLLTARFQDVTWVVATGAALAWRLLAGEGSERIIQSSNSHIMAPVHISKINALATFGVFGFAFIFCFLPQMAVWKVLYGSWLSGPSPYLDASAGEFNMWPRHLIEVLVSERGGVLAWHPVYFLGLAGLARLGRRDREWRPFVALGLVGFFLQLWLVACWSMWWGGASFGNRFFLSSLPFLAPGLAWWFGRERPALWRRGAYVALGALIVWNMGLLYQYGTEMIPREDPIPWSRVIRQNVTDVPADIWRHLAGR